MGLLDYTYRLKAEVGDAAPHDELGVSGDLSGTPTLEDDGAGGKAWRFSGVSNVAAPLRATDNNVTGSGATIAFRLRVITEGTGTTHYLSYKPATADFHGLHAGRDGVGTLQLSYRSASAIKYAQSAFAFGTGWRTYVIKVRMLTGSVNESVSYWYEGGPGHPTADGTNGPASAFGNTSMERIEIGNASGAVLEVSDFVVWGEELSDADCAAVADNLRAVLTVDTTAPTLTSPTGTGGTNAGSGSVSTDEASGSLYAVATASATAPTAAQVKLGQDHTGAAALRAVGPQTVTATGVQTIASGAISVGTRYWHYMHEDAAANQSAVVSSASFVVTAPAVAPTVTTQPTPQSVVEGSTATFTAAFDGSPAPTIQWQRNPDGNTAWADIPGETSGTYARTATILADSGDTFRAVATNTAGNVTTDVVALTVTASAVAPTILVQPVATEVSVGDAATFSVVASGTAPLSYQWRKDGVNISGATSSSYTTPATVLGDSGDVFSVVVTNAGGSATSAGVALTVSDGFDVDLEPMVLNTGLGLRVSQSFAFSAWRNGEVGSLGAALLVEGVGTTGLDGVATIQLPLTGIWRVEREFADGGDCVEYVTVV